MLAYSREMGKFRAPHPSTGPVKLKCFIVPVNCKIGEGRKELRSRREKRQRQNAQTKAGPAQENPLSICVIYIYIYIIYIYTVICRCCT